MKTVIVGKTFEEFRTKVAAVARDLGYTVHDARAKAPSPVEAHLSPETGATSVTSATPVTSETEELPLTPKKRGRKSNAEKAALAGGTATAAPKKNETSESEDLDDAEETSVHDISEIKKGKTAPQATREEALAALKSVNETKGKEIAFGILAMFGAQRFSEIPKEKYGEFVAAAQAA
jgi:hypothetical protein